MANVSASVAAVSPLGCAHFGFSKNQIRGAERRLHKGRFGETLGCKVRGGRSRVTSEAVSLERKQYHVREGRMGTWDHSCPKRFHATRQK